MKIFSILFIFFVSIIHSEYIPAYKYQYFTQYEKAGGGPFVFDISPSFENRRDQVFYSGYSFNDFWPGDVTCDCLIQSNSPLVMSDFSCPTFDATVVVTQDTYGEYIYPELGICHANAVFQGNPPLDTLSLVNTNVIDYEYIEEISTYVFDATQKLNFDPSYYSRDTLIMTDIEFFSIEEFGLDYPGGFKIKQWWYLMPPYLNTLGIEIPYVVAPMFDDPENCYEQNNIFSCDKYINSMRSFHSKTVTNNGEDELLNPIVQSSFGFHHYDVPNIYSSGWPNNLVIGWVSQLTDDQLLPEYQEDGYQVYYYDDEPITIYIKGGPVRVHGIYSGQYTIYTDEYTAYHRHAWGSNLEEISGPNPIDTIWNNIWITDNITNTDADNYLGLLYAQPNQQCEGGSDNVLGIVSGANVYVANTPENGARNNTWGQDVQIHAHIIALNESFSVQYWQNTVSQFNNIYTNPPYGDGLGMSIYGNGGSTDDRGTIYLWGGLVQKFRGYNMRGAPGPYNTNNIGYDINYNYDCNLICTPPPNYPVFTTFVNGDINNDQIVNIVDIINLINFILTDFEYISEFDLNNDYSIDVLDILSLVFIIV